MGCRIRMLAILSLFPLFGGCGWIWQSTIKQNGVALPGGKSTFLITKWNFVDGNPPGSSGLNTPGFDTVAESTTALGGSLYVLWNETNYTITPLHVARFNGSNLAPAWIPLDTTNLNIVSTHATSGISLGNCNGQLYMAWSEDQGTGKYQIHVKVYAGGTSWTSIDPGGGTLNYLPAKNADHPIVYCSSLNNLYVAWNEDNAAGHAQIRIKQYAGGVLWTSLDGGAAAGLNYNSAVSATGPILADVSGQLYIGYTEADGATNVRVAAYVGGTSWINVEHSPATSVGLNVFGQFQSDGYISIANFNGKLYAAWSDTPNGANNSVRVAVFNGNLGSPAWTLVDGGGSYASPNNYSPLVYSPLTDNITFLTLGSYNSQLYATWSEFDGSDGLYHLHMSVYNGNDLAPVWTSTDSGTETGIWYDYDGSRHNALGPALQVVNGLMYLFFLENNSLRAAYGSN